ncbi:hypothetical protein KHC27_16690 [Ancylobacter lacus]|nr:hypothetical protein [Ancylobacter lacus]
MLYDSTLRVLEAARALFARPAAGGSEAEGSGRPASAMPGGPTTATHPPPATGGPFPPGAVAPPPAAADGFAVEVVPGISALQMLCAAHAIPLNGVGEPVLVTTGRRVAEETPAAPAFAVLLDDGSGLRALRARGWKGEVWWGACLGTPDEALLAGPLEEIAAAILDARADIRARLGWVMDVWLARPA